MPVKRILVFVFAGLFVLSISAVVVGTDNKVIGDPRSIDTKYSMPVYVNLEPEGMQVATFFAPAPPSEGYRVFVELAQ